MSDQGNQPAGYANPPAQHRFKKGKSGNPKGRPKKPEDIYTVLNRALNRKVTVQGIDRRVPMREALILKLRELALSGDRRALELQRRIVAEAGAADVGNYDPERKRQAILDRIAAMMKKKGSGDAG